MASRSRMSASWKSIRLNIAVRFSRLPVAKLSMPRTSSPRSSSARTSEDPMKPAAPVTRYLAICFQDNGWIAHQTEEPSHQSNFLPDFTQRVPEPAKRPASPYNLAGRFHDSRPARPFGDLLEFIAGEKLVLLKELRDLIEKRFRVGRGQSILHTLLRGRYPIGDGAAPGQCGEELLQLHLLYGFDFREANAHAQGGVRGANLAGSFYPDAERFEYQIHFRADRKRCVHFHIASVLADVGNGSPPANVAAVGSNLRAARTTKPGAFPPLYPRDAVRGSRSFAAAPCNCISGRAFHRRSS